MSNDRNKTLDYKAINNYVLGDLVDTVQPLTKDGYKYALYFIDDYSSLTMLYFLKHRHFPRYNEISVEKRKISYFGLARKFNSTLNFTQSG